jgi:hypothetical protein
LLSAWRRTRLSLVGERMAGRDRSGSCLYAQYLALPQLCSAFVALRRLFPKRAPKSNGRLSSCKKMANRG